MSAGARMLFTSRGNPANLIGSMYKVPDNFGKEGAR
jgi:hypothetical protein